MNAARLQQAMAAIDAANAGDPNTIVVRGETRPKELAHAELATEWVHRLRPDPSEALLLAARAHHLRRWTMPRDAYPEGRAGYLRWKRDLQAQHATETGGILAQVGYDPATIERVAAILRKQGLGRHGASDPEVQAFEDALCLVFVETQFHDLAGRLDRDLMVDVVRKTLAKMSDAGRSLALTLPLAPDDLAVVKDALR